MVNSAVMTAELDIGGVKRWVVKAFNLSLPTPLCIFYRVFDSEGEAHLCHEERVGALVDWCTFFHEELGG